MALRVSRPEQLWLPFGGGEPRPPIDVFEPSRRSPWAAPQYSRAQVDKAGRALAANDIETDVYETALIVINNWRSSHSFPLNTFQTGLRRKARAVDPKALIAQRIKRLSSIEQKLRLQPTRLSQMQDIGGCRAVVARVSQVRALVRDYQNSELKHKLVRVDDYIAKPRDSGYRGMHLVYRYQSDKAHAYDGLLVEVQLRSQLQHAWATAVETVGTFLRQALKASRGHEKWLRFFSLMGTAIARRERTLSVPGTPTGEALTRELRQYARELAVQKRLNSYGAALKTLNKGRLSGAHYYLLALDPGAERIWVTAYQKYQLDRASADYLEVERDVAHRPGVEAVLVAVESIASLRRAYPNYFLDTSRFIAAVNAAVE